MITNYQLTHLRSLVYQEYTGLFPVLPIGHCYYNLHGTAYHGTISVHNSPV